MQDALQAFAQDARAGDRVAQEVFDFAGASLGVAAANHINVFDPARLLLLVQDATFSQMIEGPFRAALAESTHTALRGRVPVHIRASEEMAFAKGAAALVLERMYRGANSAQEGGPEGPM